LSQCHIRLLHDRNGAPHLDENHCDWGVLVGGVPAHDDVADSPDSRTGGIADGAAKDVGDDITRSARVPLRANCLRDTAHALRLFSGLAGSGLMPSCVRCST
jgi:hypothetical protein